MIVCSEDIKPLGDENPLDLFTRGIRAEQTRYVYTCRLKQILCKYFEDVFSGTFEERVVLLLDKGRIDPDWTCSLMIELAYKMSERTKLGKDNPKYLSPTSINTIFTPIRKLFSTNGVVLPWSRIRATFPELEGHDTRNWTRDEIRKMLRHSHGAKDRAIILVMASSGVRIGGMELKWRDIVPVYDEGGSLREGEYVLEKDASKPVACAMLRVYANTPAEYAAFITPEAYGAVQEYRAVWGREAKREPMPDDPFIKKAGQSVARLDHNGIKQRAYKVIWSAGLRGSEMKNGKRYNVPGMNGFRRFCNKGLKDARTDDAPVSSLIKKERMLGHGRLIALDAHYYKIPTMELAREYMNAVPNLTIHEGGLPAGSPSWRTGIGMGGTGQDPVPGRHDAGAPNAEPSTGKEADHATSTPDSPCPNCGRKNRAHQREEYANASRR